MKTLLYNPIFINPQAYYVFPRLTRYLQPDNESTSEPANYIDTIEVKVIAYGDTTLKRTYANTDSIDLSEFKNTWIRISLFTKVGSCVLGEWKIGNMDSDLPYIDPEVLASLKAVVIVGNKTNNDSDRAIVKNLVDPDNPFVISNAAYTEGSGYADKGSPYYGAFVTDGIDDLITSTKTVQEMLGGSNEITVVSMIHQIGLIQVYGIALTNYIRNNGGYLRSAVNSVGKTGIYGYTANNLNQSIEDRVKVINTILGDKKDYMAYISDSYVLDDSLFHVQNYTHDGIISGDGSQLAWYWTIIANKALTTDQINQVIAYFNLDRTLNPDILCNTIKQGITNENHAEFGDKLIDFSGNGRDIQLNNIAWKGDSGIGKYETELSNTSIWTQSKETTSSPFSSSYNGLSGWIVFANTELTNSADMPSFKIQVKGLLEGQELIYRYYDSNGQSNVYSMTKDGEYTLPSDVRTAKPQTSNTSGFQVVKNEANIITITQIPSHAGALCLDGINDFGKVTGMPIYKDYTVVADYERLKIGYIGDKGTPAILSKSYTAGQGAFLMNIIGNTGEHMNAYTFGNANNAIFNDLSKKIYYQSKYKMQGFDMTIGSGVDGDSLWLGVIRDNDSRFFNGAIYSLMSFPYSMSEFLIERQLKKYKLGTLYPDMVEFRPVINSNVLLDAKPTFVIRGTSTYLNAGDYVPENSQIWVSIKMNNAADRITKFTVNGKTIDIPENAYNEVSLQYGFSFVIDKSPQKITMDIQVDSSLVQFNPIIDSNIDIKKIDYWDNDWNVLHVGDYISIGNNIKTNITVPDGYKISEVTSDAFDNITIEKSITDFVYDVKFYGIKESPQKINLTISLLEINFLKNLMEKDEIIDLTNPIFIQE